MDVAATRYTVRDGDTVWGIAHRKVGALGDPRPLVDAIVTRNSVDPGALVPGDVLLIPASPDGG